MCKYERGEKYGLIAFVLSWLIFSIVVMVRNLVIVGGITILSWRLCSFDIFINFYFT